MKRCIVSVRPDETVVEVAAKHLVQNDISALPVCDGAGTLLGVISEGDLLRPFGREHGLRRSWWLAVLSDRDRLTQLFADYVRSDERRACDLMTSPAISVTEDTSIGEIARLLAITDNNKQVSTLGISHSPQRLLHSTRPIP
jgi:CBS domain-containing protein